MSITSSILTDNPTQHKRSWNMSKIRSNNTIPEITVRKVLHIAGIRYRLHASNLPGNPDLSNNKRKYAVFVNGYFWH